MRCNHICKILITSLFTKLTMARGQRSQVLVFESSCHLPSCLPTRWRLHTVLMLNVNQGSCETSFYNLWFDPTGNWTRVDRFCSKCFRPFSVALLELNRPFKTRPLLEALRVQLLSKNYIMISHYLQRVVLKGIAGWQTMRIATDLAAVTWPIMNR